MSIDVSWVVNCHKEGMLLHRTFKNIAAVVAEAREHNITMEVIIIADSPDAITQQYIKQQKQQQQKTYIFHEVSFSDLGRARNFGIQHARGKYLTFLDGDDLYSYNWVSASYALMEQLGMDCVLFPEWMITFQSQINSEYHSCFVKENYIHHISQYLDEHLSIASILEYHPYISAIFAPTHLLKQYPYTSNVPEIKISYEDWYQNCTFLHIGIPLRAVRNTVFFYRKAPEIKGSLLMQSKKNESVLDKHPLFDPHSFYRRYETFSDWVKEQKVINSNYTSPPSPPVRKVHKWTTYLKGRIVLLGVLYYHKIENLLPRRKGYIISFRVHRYLMNMKDRIKNKIKQKNVLNAPILQDLPPYIITQWKTIAYDIEPELILAPNFNRLLTYVIPKKSVLTTTYYDICKKIGVHAPYDHIIIVPYLLMGGSCKLAIRYANTLLAEQIDKKILLITTLPIVSSHLHLLHKNIQIIELGLHYLPHLLKEQHTLLLYRILIQSTHAKITLINSELAYRVFSLYGAIFKRHRIRCYVFIFSIERAMPDAMPYGYAPAYYYALSKWFDTIITDNKNVIHNVQHLLGIPPEKCHCLYQPVDHILSEEALHLMSDEQPLRLIWASRLSEEKQPNLLIQLIQHLKNENVSLDIYTDASGTDYYNKLLATLSPNIHYKGAYENWYDLHPEQYDALLYTGIYDGMPNVVLEALSSGLVVIAPNQNIDSRGGIGEIITHNDNGFLVDNYQDPKAYIAFVQQLEKNRYLKKQFYTITKRKLQDRHSQDNYRQQLSTLMLSL